ncbi:MAG: hypothetical protein D6710_11785 [Nitrospirae bacterium]|nr:MAG: hypothetical protein D6710_11785 [Nitrospirota bacterium]
MANPTGERRSLCAFDYLPGTLATAYKGPIQSLVISDFCIETIDDSVEIKGRFVDLPESSYQIRLIAEGKVISEAEIKGDIFSLTVNKKDFEDFKHLQIDIIQKGRHIGTFLIKTPEQAGPLISALEVAKEVEGLNLRGLVRLIENRYGLRKKAEHLVAASLSPKKNWQEFSTELFSFSKDLYWSDMEAFQGWLPFIIRFFIISIQELPAHIKPLDDLVYLLELIAEKSEPSLSERTLRLLEENLNRYAVDLTSRFVRLMKTLIRLVKISKKGSLTIPLIMVNSFIEKLEKTPFLSEETLKLLDRSDSLLPYSKASREETDKILNNLKEALIIKDIPIVEELLNKIDHSVFDSSKMVKALFKALRDSEKIDESSLKRILKQAEKTISGNEKALETFSEEVVALIEFYLKKQDFGQAASTLQLLDVFEHSLKEDFLFRQRLIESVFKSEKKDIEDIYLKMASRVIIPTSGFKGYIEDTWEPIFNKKHLERLKSFLMILIKGGYRNERFLASVITNLYMIDLFIPDEALFQRLITEYLNEVPLDNLFILHYLLLKRLPVYYNEVGATGRIRDISTELDSWGNDPVLYFLRKQVHVNSGPHNIELVKKILLSWKLNSLEPLRNSIPDDLLNSYNSAILRDYNGAINLIFKQFNINSLDCLLPLKDDLLKGALKSSKLSAEIKEKVILMISLFKELNNKYGIIKDSEVPEPVRLISDMDRLKKIFTSSKKSTPEEQLYFKRHIAFGIPSVMGTYREEKFDSLMEFIKFEDKLRGCLDMIGDPSSFELKEGLGFLSNELKLFYDVFHIFGFNMPNLKETIILLNKHSLYLSQLIDLFRGLEKELIFVIENFYRWFLSPVNSLLGKLKKDELSSPLRHSLKALPDRQALTDIALRQIITSVPGLQEYDRYLNNIMAKLVEIAESQPDRLINQGKQKDKALYVLHALTAEEATTLAPIIGSKSKNLAVLFSKGIEVPFSVVLSASFTFGGRERLKELAKRAVSLIEEHSSRAYGSESAPLFLAVRSGSYVSMPGILDSILYCGITSKTLKALLKETDNPEFCWDSYRRFIEHYLSVVHSLNPPKTEGDSKTQCEHYLEFARANSIVIPDDPWEQLTDCINGVYDSWFSEKALSYRKAMSISEHWGTAVLLMPMLWANFPEAGASVFFSRDPKTFSPIPFGETKRSSTGDDIVYGGHISTPISSVQSRDVLSLEESDPELYRIHYETARAVEEAMEGVPQEIETSYLKDNGKWRLWVLQSRPMEFYRKEIDRFHEVCKMESNILSRGIGVHGGALSGIATFEKDVSILKQLKEQSDMPLILIRKETSTTDAETMPYVDGLLTSTGGVTSHASVLAKKFNITAVVGCTELVIDEKKGFAKIGDYTIKEGTPLSIDGATGRVYSGICTITFKEGTVNQV